MPLTIPAADKFSAVIGPNSAVSDPGDTANHDVTGATVALPRAGTYWFTFLVFGTATVNPTTVGFGVAFSGTTTTLAAETSITVASGGSAVSGLVQTVSDTLPTTAISTAAGSSKGLSARGTITVSTAGTLAVRFNRASNAISFAAGGGGFVIEK